MFKFLFALFCTLSVALSMRVPTLDLPPKPQGLECEACTGLLGAVESWIEKNSTVSYVEQRLDSVCQLVPGFANACDQLVAFGLQEAIDFLQAGGSPQELCTKFGLCSALLQKVEGTCEDCQVVVGAFEKWAQSPAVEKDIVGYFDLLCKLVPSFNKTCEAVIEVGIGEVISWINLHENATSICSDLRLCSNTVAYKPIPTPTKVAGPVECDGCKWVIHVIENWLQSNKTESAIETDLGKLCDKIKDISATCIAIVDVGVPTVINWIEKYATPQLVCQELKLCTAQTPSDPIPVEPLPLVGNDEECDGCKFVVTAIEHWLENNSTQSAIITDLEKLCELIPSLDNTCRALFEAGIPSVINWIHDNEDPTTVCTQFGLCTASSQKPSRPIQMPQNELECESCKYTFRAAEDWLARNSTQQEFIDNLEELCQLIPSLEATCDAVVEAGVHTIIRWIQANEDPTEICTRIGVCSASSAAILLAPAPREQPASKVSPLKFKVINY